MNKPPSCVFFDRDGVINIPPPPEQRYITRPEDFQLMPGIAEAVRMLNQHQIPVAVVTNQKCVAIGRLTESDLLLIHERMADLLADQGAQVDAIRYCPHRDEDQCACRKPRPGMISDAARELGVDASNGWLIGDQARDITAGKAAGCRTLRVGSEADGTAGEDVFLAETTFLPAWIKENLLFQQKEGCQNKH